MFRKILIANRGEIALRILRGCRELGVEAVVTYSEADRDSLPVQLADEAICIGPADARRSYLSAPAVISAALVTGCDAIHPGYGFLSEDEGFAEVVAAHGLTFIGPPAAVLERFASKAGTRQLLGAHGLPTIPGSDGMLRDEMHALDEAERIGYPVLIKPSAGGGGKGMRMVRTGRELESALRVCRSEAQGGLRRRFALPREVARREPPRRDPGRHRPVRPGRPPRRARLLGPAPPPEDHRGGADAGAFGRGPGRSRGSRGAGRDRGRLREPRHARIPRRRRRQLLLHRDQLPDPGRASGHRDADRRGHGHAPRSGSPPASRSASPSRTSSCAGTRSSSGSTPRTQPTSSGRAPASSSATTRPAARASGSTRTCSAATRSRPTTTRCSASSSSGDRTGRPPSPARASRSTSSSSRASSTNVAIHQAMLENEVFLTGRMTTNLLDRVGSEAFLAAAARS